MSNRERIARAAEEAKAAAAEKAAKKAPGDATGSRPKRTKEPVRMKIVWEVCTGTGRVVKTFAYADKEAAEAAARTLTASKGEPHMLRGTKVPMQ